MTENSFTNVKRRLFSVDFDLNNLNDNVVPSVTPKDDKLSNYFHSNENPIQNDNFCIESDDYDSDCSLGSLNSLYLRFKDKSKYLYFNETNGVSENEIHNKKNDMSATVWTSVNNKVKNTQQLEEKNSYDKIETEKPAKKLNTMIFYGKQKSITHRSFQSLSCVRFFAKKSIKSKSRILKSKSSVHKFKQNSILLKNRKHRRNSMNKKMLPAKHIFQKDELLIRNLLKYSVPLMPFNFKVVKKFENSHDTCEQSNTCENSLRNEIDFITDCDTIIKKEDDFENELYFDFITGTGSTDDFEDRNVIDSIINNLFHDND